MPHANHAGASNKYLLHFFSGRRRPRDFQHWVESLRPQAPYSTLSLDVANDSINGDMSSPDNVLQWLLTLPSGETLGALGGPPCETWSGARFADIDDGDGKKRGPRPLRSHSRPWGMAHIGAEERQQVVLGNTLMRTTLTFATLALHTGTPLVMEHPARHHHPDAPCIWDQPEVAAILRHPAAYLLDLDQCVFGAPARKTTTLLVIHLPQLRRLLHSRPDRGRCTHRSHTYGGGAIGRDSQGRFLTAQLKEYPDALCRLLAEAFTDRWHQLPSLPEPPQPPPHLLQCYVPLDPYYTFKMHADYARHNTHDDDDSSS